MNQYVCLSLFDSCYFPLGQTIPIQCLNTRAFARLRSPETHVTMWPRTSSGKVSGIAHNTRQTHWLQHQKKGQAPHVRCNPFSTAVEQGCAKNMTLEAASRPAACIQSNLTPNYSIRYPLHMLLSFHRAFVPSQLKPQNKNKEQQWGTAQFDNLHVAKWCFPRQLRAPEKTGMDTLFHSKPNGSDRFDKCLFVQTCTVHIPKIIKT